MRDYKEPEAYTQVATLDEFLARVFGNVFDVKRLCPGTINFAPRMPSSNEKHSVIVQRRQLPLG
jgi:hypothetical protein